MSDQKDFSGKAALSICEALLLAMNDHKLLPEREILGLLEDAAKTHENVDGSKEEHEKHLAVARVINQMIEGGYLSRRSRR